MFSQWSESRQFRKLLPPEILALVPSIKQEAKSLTQQYYKDKTSVPPYKEVAKVADPLHSGKKLILGFVTIEEWLKRRYPGVGIYGFDKNIGSNVVMWRIPMIEYDTIYHELVHAYDPKLAKGVPPKKGEFQNNRSAHEVDAYIGGHVDLMKDKLNASSPEEKTKLLQELKKWMTKAKGESDYDTYNLPELLKGMTVYHLSMDKPNWRKFISVLYNELF